MSETVLPPDVSEVLQSDTPPSGPKNSRRQDPGLRRGIGDPLLWAVAAAMTFLAALALGAFVAAAALGQHWQLGAEAVVTVQVPQPDAAAPPSVPPGTTASLATQLPSAKRLDRALAVLRGTPGIAAARVLSADELAALLRPWLGTAVGAMTLPLPAVIDVRLGEPAPDMTALAAALDAAAPGTLAESHGSWASRLMVLTHSFEACTGLALLVVTLVAAAVVCLATRAAVAARRDAIEVLHGLGATDAYIAGPVAARAMKIAGLGGLIGAVVALPMLLWLAALAAPILGAPAFAMADLAQGGLRVFAPLPLTLWVGLPALPLIAAAIGWLTASITVRRWLQNLL